MIFPPALINVEVGGGQRKPWRLWLPVILLWPLLVIAAAILLPLAAVAEVFLSAKGVRPFSLLIALSRVVAELRGTQVEVTSKSPVKRDHVSLYIF
ncbi:MAG: hypothetical protein JXA18_00815 [Chitinispirillaceae bacterium]|nr:hypothetical protein [Chitinispirillaceae bacterium]